LGSLKLEIKKGNYVRSASPPPPSKILDPPLEAQNPGVTKQGRSIGVKGRGSGIVFKSPVPCFIKADTLAHCWK